MRFAFMLLTMAAVSSLTGCAFTSEKIDIHYVQQQGVTAEPYASNTLVSVTVKDSRVDKSKVSSKKNGYGMETAPITSNEEVSVTFSRAIEQEIRARGFRAGSGDGDIRLNAEINRFYNDHKIGFFSGDAVADLSLSVRVSDAADKLLYSRTIMSQGKEENTQLATGNNAGIALDRALAAGMRDLFNDASFIAALKRGAPTQSTHLDVKGRKSTKQMLEDLAADKSLSYDEYLRRYNIISREQQ
ncbi:YajG family lipoprotein [Pseudomonas syringae]|uniref:YajG family lipoprotein n=1 Tax=Pseudomonas syringae CC1417 TaxID=1357272 RepID=A0AAU8LDH4_PSESX